MESSWPGEQGTTLNILNKYLFVTSDLYFIIYSYNIYLHNRIIDTQLVYYCINIIIIIKNTANLTLSALLYLVIVDVGYHINSFGYFFFKKQAMSYKTITKT